MLGKKGSPLGKAFHQPPSQVAGGTGQGLSTTPDHSPHRDTSSVLFTRQHLSCASGHCPLGAPPKARSPLLPLTRGTGGLSILGTRERAAARVRGVPVWWEAHNTRGLKSRARAVPWGV